MSETNPLNEGLKHCDFYLVKKKRQCRMLVKKTEKYCCEHQPTSEIPPDGNTELGIRITCPYDRKHTCFAHKLNKHLKVCNSRPKQSEAFIVKGINCGSSEVPQETNKAVTLCNTPTDDIKRVINKINRIVDDNPIKIEEKICSHKFVEDGLQLLGNGDTAKKHLKQISSVLGMLEEYAFLNTDTCFVEFGAGRGGLSYWISCAMEDKANLVLIEKSSPKHKKDNKLDKNPERVKRIRADISDLVLDEIELVNKSKNVVGVTKHLCGAGTDLAIRCMANMSKNRDKLIGFVLTFCCHHRCSWSSYTGREVFQKLGISESDFRIMCGLVSWATCGSGLSRQLREKMANHDEDNSNLEEGNRLQLSAQERERIGIKCKNLIDWGRTHFIKEMGFKCKLYEYVKKEITLENVCIVAIKNEYGGNLSDFQD